MNKSWYAAHVIMYVKYKQIPQKEFPVFENIYLIEAETEEEAFIKGEIKGKEEEGDDDRTFKWGGIPSRWIFGGVRKITKCQDKPKDGTEITYLQFLVDSEDNLKKLINSDEVTVLYQEEFHE